MTNRSKGAKMNRRLVVGVVAVLAVTVFAVTAPAATRGVESGSTAIANEEITIVTFGGANTERYKAVWYEPFSRSTGIKVNSVAPVEYAKIKAQVESRNILWDVAYTDTFFALANCGKLFERINLAPLRAAGIPNRYLRNKCSLPFPITAMILVYDTTKVGPNPPKNWADFFNLKKYPGKRGMWNFVQNGSVEAALLASGVQPNKLYPLDTKRAFRKLDTIKHEILWTQTVGQLADQLVNGQVVMSLIFASRAGTAAERGAKIAPVYRRQIITWDSWSILKGSPNKQAAERFLRFGAQARNQATYINLAYNGATNSKVRPNLNALQQVFAPTNPRVKATAVDLNQRYWALNFGRLNREFVAWRTR